MLEPFSFTLEKQGVIQGLVEGRVMHLIEEHVRPLSLAYPRRVPNIVALHQFAGVLAETGLGEIIDAWKTRQGNVRPPTSFRRGPIYIRRASTRFANMLVLTIPFSPFLPFSVCRGTP